MEGHCTTGQSPQWAVVPMEEEEEEGGGGGQGEEEEKEEEEEKKEEEEEKKIFITNSNFNGQSTKRLSHILCT